MSLAEVEAAAESLSPAEKEELFRFLAASLRRDRPKATRSLLAVDRLARLQKMFPHGPVKGDIQAVIDYDRGLD